MDVIVLKTAGNAVLGVGILVVIPISANHVAAALRTAEDAVMVMQDSFATAVLVDAVEQ